MMRILLGVLLIWSCEASSATWQYTDPAVAPPNGKCGDDDAGFNSPDDQRCGPTYWPMGKDYEACGEVGTQSPINAQFSNAPILAGTYSTDLQLTPGTCGVAEFKVTQYTVRVEFPKDCGETFRATWRGNTYRLVYFEYHAPSEHTVDGAYYPLEVHHVHKDGSKDYMVIAIFGTVDATVTPAVCQSVLTNACTKARFFDSILTLGKSSSANSVVSFEAALQLVKQAASGTEEVPGEDSQDVLNSVVANNPYTNFIVPLPSYFYSYSGSFTTPPCKTGVEWILIPDPVPIFETSLARYRMLINALQGNQLATKTGTITFKPPAPAWDVNLGNNNRPLQSIGTTNKLYKIGTMPVKNVPWKHQPQDSSIASSGINGSSGDSKSGDSRSGSSAGSGNSLEWLQSSSYSSESDSWDSYDSSGSADSGSSGFYMAVWKWIVLGLLLCCCLSALASVCCMKKPKKTVKRKAMPIPKEPPAPVPTASPKDEEIVLVTDVEPLLMPVPNMMPAVSVPFPMAQAVPINMVPSVVPSTTSYSSYIAPPEPPRAAAFFESVIPVPTTATPVTTSYPVPATSTPVTTSFMPTTATVSSSYPIGTIV